MEQLDLRLYEPLASTASLGYWYIWPVIGLVAGIIATVGLYRWYLWYTSPLQRLQRACLALRRLIESGASLDAAADELILLIKRKISLVTGLERLDSSTTSQVAAAAGSLLHGSGQDALLQSLEQLDQMRFSGLGIDKNLLFGILNKVATPL